MKKFLAMLLALVLCLSLTACGGKDDGCADTTGGDDTQQTTDGETSGGDDSSAAPSDMMVAMVTDYGDITDESFNQTTYEACKSWCDSKGVKFTYYKPAGDSTAERVAMVEAAVDEGYNTIVMPGFAFAETISQVADTYPDVNFIALDVAESDVGTIPGNTYCAVYQEELAGYMAGVAAVKLGYSHLGFLGGMAVPAVQRFGYGFVQGANDAAKELGKTVDMNYSWLYGANFQASPELQTMMNGWYSNGTEIVFACGGSMFNSVVAAAAANDGLVVGVDVDQSAESDAVVTSAMKGLSSAVQWAVAKVYDGSFSDIGGNGTSLGAKDDAVGLPTATWRLENYTVAEYEAQLADMASGKLVVDSMVAEEDFAKLAATEWSNVALSIIE